MDVLYDAIVDLFEKYPEDEWTVDTLKWWNEYISPHNLSINL